MKTSRLITVAFRAMSRYKLRSAFMMLGTFLGIAALTLVVSIGQAAQVKMLRTMRQIIGDSSVLVIGGGGLGNASPRTDANRLTIDDIDAAVKEVPQVEAWDPRQDLVTSVRRGDASTTVRIIGQSERSEKVWGRTVSRGEYFDAAAVNGSSRVALIGETAAHKLFGNDDPLDAEVRIGSVPFRIIGVLEPFGVDLHGMDRDNEIVVPITTLMRRLTNIDSIAAARIMIRDADQSDNVANEIRRVLRARQRNFSILTTLRARRIFSTIRRILMLYVPLAAAIILLIGAAVSATLMLASVSERVSEIGLRRAVGARPEDIRLQFLIETTVTTLCGGIGGIVLGYTAARWVATRFQLGGVFSWSAVLLGIAASTIVGLIAGLLPAKRAAELQPIDALR